MIEEELERCRPWLEAALEYADGTHEFGDIAECVKIGSMQLWPAPRGAMVTEVLQYPRKKVLHVFLAGGELDQILDMNDDLEAWGKSQGCEAITIAGRAGWAKVLKSLGWRPSLVSLSREI